MRIVLDTNVLLSALLSPRRASRYAKCKDVLQPHRVGMMVNNMLRSVLLDELLPLPEGIEVNDPDDVFLLVMALAGEADYFVTGDHRAGLLQRGSISRTRIVTFCTEDHAGQLSEWSLSRCAFR